MAYLIVFDLCVTLQALVLTLGAYTLRGVCLVSQRRHEFQSSALCWARCSHQVFHSVTLILFHRFKMPELHYDDPEVQQYLLSNDPPGQAVVPEVQLDYRCNLIMKGMNLTSQHWPMSKGIDPTG
ncbi:hypothetical protein CC1G_04525 [Coprinopsis cinerea okayama7|uniref:Uncharacterized protein n=1 Tax=Coprinopsis cinerea (strain Okayama-7 / 130 / ATCC MYA-4618 / FGSC 9003) TaxID=240176 RepID=A8N5E7_COPC7|nr:hypothetical protein CC1G_04525 [Coprinopsis cinerea okayama7\|eukprot:XP_001830092.2 hypothetical protein CC1G_04525 [Coprinopsis cinerea okayama7\